MYETVPAAIWSRTFEDTSLQDCASRMTEGGQVGDSCFDFLGGEERNLTSKVSLEDAVWNLTQIGPFCKAS